MNGQVRLGERGEGNDACRAAGPVKNEPFAKFEIGAAGVSSKIFGVPVLSKLADGAYKLSGGRAEEPSEGV